MSDDFLAKTASFQCLAYVCVIEVLTGYCFQLGVSGTCAVAAHEPVILQSIFALSFN